MGEATVIILHPPLDGDGPLTMLLHGARQRLAEHQAALFVAAGADRVTIDRRPRAATFASRLAEVGTTVRGGIVLLGAGAVPLLRGSDARRLVQAARGVGPAALTNNRHSSDVLAMADARLLLDMADARSDNALPRLLTDRGLTVEELPDRGRLAMDLDTPLDLALLALAAGVPRPLRDLAHVRQWTVPRLAELRAVAADPGAELLIFGRVSSRGLAWLERHTACRVRFLAEERGLRTAPVRQRPARATIGRLLDARGPEQLASIVGDLADGAVLDSRVLLADRFGRDEGDWPSPEDRYASDLLRSADVTDPWLRALTASAAGSQAPIVLGGHTVVGPGLAVLLGGDRSSPFARR